MACADVFLVYKLTPKFFRVEGSCGLNWGMISRNVGSACWILILHPVCVRVVALVLRMGSCTGKGEIQVGPWKHRLCAIGLNLTLNLSGIFARCN